MSRPNDPHRPSTSNESPSTISNEPPPKSGFEAAKSALDELDKRVGEFLSDAYSGAVDALKSAGLLGQKVFAGEAEKRPPPSPSGWPDQKERKAADGSTTAEGVDTSTMASPTSRWFPLAGPPSNLEEKLILQDAQEKDKEELQESYLSDSNQWRRASIMDAANANCVDLEYAYRTCLHRGSIWNRFKGCVELDAEWKKCTARQAELLEKLGFADKRRTEGELAWIVREADRKYLVEKREEEAAAANGSKA